MTCRATLFSQCIDRNYQKEYNINKAKTFNECIFAGCIIQKHPGNHDQKVHGNRHKTFNEDGPHDFVVKGFASKQKLNNHWQNGRTHKEEYPGWTKEQYVARGVELVEKPVGGDVLGHTTKEGIVIRYDIKTNDFVKGHPQKGIYTLFKPKDGMEYYLSNRKDDEENGKKG